VCDFLTSAVPVSLYGLKYTQFTVKFVT